MKRFQSFIKEESEERFQYPEAGKNAPAGVLKEIQGFKELPESYKKDTPLLYYLLGDGTPAYKMSKEDSAYKHEPQDGQMCGNCEYAFTHIGSGEHICSQVTGEIKLDHWCRLWEPTKE